MKHPFIHVRFFFFTHYYSAFIASSFASPIESVNNDDLSLFGTNDASLFDNNEAPLSSLVGGDPAELTFDSSGDDPNTSLFADDSLLSPDLSASITPLDLNQDQDLLADAGATDDECVSLDDQNDRVFISKRRTAANDVCTPPEAGRKKKTPPVEPPPVDPEDWKPPPGSNPGRHSDAPWNDPAPRPSEYRPNTDFDFQYCPAGVFGFRQYAVCDSGSRLDIRVLPYNMVQLINVIPRVFITFIFIQYDSIDAMMFSFF